MGTRLSEFSKAGRESDGSDRSAVAESALGNGCYREVVDPFRDYDITDSVSRVIGDSDFIGINAVGEKAGDFGRGCGDGEED